MLRAGLWEKEVRLSDYGDIDYSEIYRLSSEQSVVGLIAAGLGKARDVKIPQNLALTIAGEVVQLEKRNVAMNEFVASIINELQYTGIRVVLVKGQGVAQCYERPLWRSCGDIDLFFDDENYKKAALYLTPFGKDLKESSHGIKHTEMTIESWSVELHGTLRTQLGRRIDNVVDEVQVDTFFREGVRTWSNGLAQVLLPSPDNDIFFVFTHYLQHFFIGGCGLRQICDWVRLLWVYRESIDMKLLETRLKKSGLMSEWKAFASLAIDYLEMPKEAMPLYSSSKKWQRKTESIMDLIITMGNMGHNRDVSYRQKSSGLRRKIQTFYYITKDAWKTALVFPLDSIRVWCRLNNRELKKYVEKISVR